MGTVEGRLAPLEWSRPARALFSWIKTTTDDVSHIICETCADTTGFSKANPVNRKCPTCKTPLPHEHDAVIANLSPTEEYKTSILSGLDPATIMDCANRALSFWNYQIQTEAYVDGAGNFD